MEWGETAFGMCHMREEQQRNINCFSKVVKVGMLSGKGASFGLQIAF